MTARFFLATWIKFDQQIRLGPFFRTIRLLLLSPKKELRPLLLLEGNQHGVVPTCELFDSARLNQFLIILQQLHLLCINPCDNCTACDTLSAMHSLEEALDLDNNSDSLVPYRIVAYKFACGYRCDFDDAAMHQLRLGHQLKNELVAIWKERQEKIASAWLTQPKVNELTHKVEVTVEEVEALYEAWSQSKVETRDRKGSPELKVKLAESRKGLKELRSQLKIAKTIAVEALKDQFQQISQEEFAAVKDTYRRYVQETTVWDEQKGEHIERTPLTWAMHGMILDQHKAAVAKVKNNRIGGQASDLRFKRWTGEGQLAVQLQRPSGCPPRTPERLMKLDQDNRWRNFVRFPENPARKKRVPLSVRIGADENKQPVFFEIPEVIWHRQIDPEADITGIKISRRQDAGNFRLWVEITARAPMVLHSGADGIVGIDTGWRMMPDGSLRVAVWRGHAERLDVPHHLTEAIINDGEGGEVRIPSQWVKKWHFSEELRSRRDKSLEIMRNDLIDNFAHILDLPPLEDISVADIKRWKSPSRFAALAFKLRNLGNGSVRGEEFSTLTTEQEELINRLEDWRKRDKKLWSWEVNNRQSVINFRNDLFKVVANRMLAVAKGIAVEEPYVASVIKSKEDDGHQEEGSRKHWSIAAPSSLILAIKQAAAARDIKLEVFPAAGTTLIHKACGYKNPPGSGISSIMIKCENCGDKYDQDAASAWALVEMAKMDK